MDLDKEDLKVVRLENGEILFSKVLINEKSKNNGYLELHWPMKVLIKYDQTEKSTHVALLKWLPLTDSTSIPLAARCIMTGSELGKDYRDFYLKTVNETVNESTEEEMNRMSKVLADFEPSGLAN